MTEVLSTDERTIEGGTLLWSSADGNTTAARSTAQAHGGTASVSATATAAGNAQVVISTDISAVVVGRTYTFIGWFRESATGHFPQLSMYFLPSFTAGTNGASASEVANSWVQAQNSSGVAPSGTTSIRLYATAFSLGAGEVVYWDDFSLDDGTTSGPGPGMHVTIGAV